MSSIFDASVLMSKENTMTQEEMVQELVPKIEAILRDRFPHNRPRQQVKVFRDRISFAAPCCGDSSHNDYKKRGNIILTGKYKNMYKCHNCGAYMSIPKFLKRYGEDASLGLIEYINANKSESTTNTVADASINLLYSTDTIDKLAINRAFFRNLLELEECDQPNAGHNYLVRRCQYDFSKFMYQPKYKLLFLLNLTPNGDIFGVQVKHMNPNYKGPKYKTYSLSKIHRDFLKSDVKIPDDIDSLSMIFNILLIDCRRDVTITEGPMDAFLIDNCIALCGAGKHTDFHFKYRYMFDDDKTGRTHSLERLSDGHFVFMWDRFKKDTGLPDRKKWDMNDVVMWASQNKRKLPSLNNYFSNDMLDAIGI